MRVQDHPILGKRSSGKPITMFLDGEPLVVYEGETIASALMAEGKRVFRYTRKERSPRGYFCGLGRCTDCTMTVDGIPQVRTCITLVKEGMRVETQEGLGRWSEKQC